MESARVRHWTTRALLGHSPIGVAVTLTLIE